MSKQQDVDKITELQMLEELKVMKRRIECLLKDPEELRESKLSDKP